MSQPPITRLPGLTQAPVIEVRGTGPDEESLRRELVAALVDHPQRIPSKFFYDERGGRLFEEITTLPEYYQARAERRLLEQNASEIASGIKVSQLVELGSGAATKTRVLLEALWDHGTLDTYVPFDIDEAMLRRVAAEINHEHPGLHVRGIVGDFATHVAPLPRVSPGDRRLVIFLGGTIGNLHPDTEAPAFLRSVATAMAPSDFLLLGVDLVKDVEVIEAAYNDARGITAEFNRNILNVVNGLLGADFDPQRFRHRAFYDTERDWIEMRLVSDGAQTVRLGPDRPVIELDDGDEIRTEISAKYDLARIDQLLRSSGFFPDTLLTDPDRPFALALAHRRMEGDSGVTA